LLGKNIFFHNRGKKTNGNSKPLAELKRHQLPTHLGISSASRIASIQNRLYPERPSTVELSSSSSSPSLNPPAHQPTLLSFSMRASPFSLSLFHGKDQNGFFDDLLKIVVKFSNWLVAPVDASKTFDKTCRETFK